MPLPALRRTYPIPFTTRARHLGVPVRHTLHRPDHRYTARLCAAVLSLRPCSVAPTSVHGCSIACFSSLLYPVPHYATSGTSLRRTSTSYPRSCVSLALSNTPSLHLHYGKKNLFLAVPGAGRLHRIYHQSFFLVAIFLSYFYSESVFSLQPLVLPLSASPSSYVFFVFAYNNYLPVFSLSPSPSIS